MGLVPQRPRLLEGLPVIEEVIDPEPVKACPQAWRCIGQEVSEQFDCEPARFLRRRLIRRKFVRRGEANATPIIAPLPPCLQEGGLPAAGLLAQVLIAKYADQLPLYRQEAIYRQRHGVHLPRRPWPAGWGWPQTGYGPCTTRSTRVCWQTATSRLTRHPSPT